MKLFILILFLFSSSFIYGQIPPIKAEDETFSLQKKDSLYYYYPPSTPKKEIRYFTEKKITFNTGLLIKIFDLYIGLYTNIEYKPFKSGLSLMSGIEGYHLYAHIQDDISVGTKKIKNHYNIIGQIHLGLGWKWEHLYAYYNSYSIYITASPYIHTYKETLQLLHSNHTIQRKTSGWNLGLTQSYSNEGVNIQWHIVILRLDNKLGNKRYLIPMPFWNLKIGISLYSK